MSDPIVTHASPSHNSPSILDYLDRPIALHRCFATLAGSLTAGVMLSQALYWTRVQLRTHPESDGWFWKTQEDWEEETAVTRYEQDTARKRLRDHPGKFWHEARRGLPAKLYFHVDLPKLEQALLQLPLPPPLPTKKSHQHPQTTEKPDTSIRPTGELASGKAGDQIPEIPPTITETTAETTLETSPEIDINVGSNVGIDREKPKRQLRLTPRQEDAVEELENQLDTHSRGALCVIVSDRGLGEERALNLLQEAMEIEAARRVKTTLGQCFMDLVFRDAARQGIALGFKRPDTP